MTRNEREAALQQECQTLDHSVRAQMSHEKQVAKMESNLQALQTENAELRTVLASIIADLPMRRDWLNPELEKRARALFTPGS